MSRLGRDNGTQQDLDGDSARTPAQEWMQATAPAAPPGSRYSKVDGLPVVRSSVTPECLEPGGHCVDIPRNTLGCGIYSSACGSLSRLRRL